MGDTVYQLSREIADSAPTFTMSNIIAPVAPVVSYADRFKARAKVAEKEVPTLTACDGSSIAGYTYIGKRQVLVIHFRKNGKVYEYAKITKTQYVAFIEAESQGRFFNQNFLDAVKHPCTKIADEYLEGYDV